MTKDTLKSLGYLKKSLKMSKRAIEKNQKDDNISDIEFNDLKAQMDKTISLIETWETHNTLIDTKAINSGKNDTNLTNSTGDSDLLTVT